MPLINLDAVLNPLPELKDHILDYIPRATTSEFGIVALGSGINVDSFGRISLDTQEYSDRLTAIDSSLDLAKRGIANRYDSSLTYNSGERIVLANGDIVKSTVDGNVNDPNVDMTGWVLDRSDSNIKTWSGRTQEQHNKENPSPFDFGVKGDGVTDDTQAFINLELKYQNQIIDLFGKRYFVTQDFTKNKYINGYFTIGGKTKSKSDSNSNSYIDITKVKIKKNLPDWHSATSAIRSMYGFTYFFPQGFFIDEKANEIFFTCTTGGKQSGVTTNWSGWVLVFDYQTLNFKSAFYGVPTNWVENFHIEYVGSTRYMIAPYTTDAATTSENSVSNNQLAVYVLPSNIASLNNTKITPSKVFGSQLGFYRVFKAGANIIAEAFSTGITQSTRCSFVYSLNDVLNSENPQPLGTVGFESIFTGSKTQGAFSDGHHLAQIFCRTTDATDTSGLYNSDFGIVFYNNVGDVVNQTFVDSQSWLNYVNTVSKNSRLVYSGKVEAEGGQWLDKSLMSMQVLFAKDNGVDAYHPVIIEVGSYDSDATDLSSSVSFASSRSIGNQSSRAVRVSKPLHPITGELLTTMGEIGYYAAKLDITEYSFYTGAWNILDPDGVVMPAYHWVTFNMNNGNTAFVTVKGGRENYTRLFGVSTIQGAWSSNNNPIEHSVTSTNNSTSAFKVKNSLRTGTLQVSGDSLGLYDTTNSKWMIRTNKTGEVVYVSSALNLQGTIYPDVDNVVDLGTSARTYANTYTQKVSYGATVYETVGNGSPEGVLVGGVGSSYRDKLNGDEYVKTSGAGNTGWYLKQKIYNTSLPKKADETNFTTLNEVAYFAAQNGFAEYSFYTGSLKLTEPDGTVIPDNHWVTIKTNDKKTAFVSIQGFSRNFSKRMNVTSADGGWVANNSANKTTIVADNTSTVGFVAKNASREGSFQVSGSDLGIYDQTNSSWLLSSSSTTSETTIKNGVNVKHPTTHTYVTTQPLQNDMNSGLRVINERRSGLFYTSGAGTLGIYDLTNSKWVIRSETSGAVYIDYKSGVFDAAGTGSPEGVITASVGSTYRRTDGGNGSTFYVKESGTGNTGWIAK